MILDLLIFFKCSCRLSPRFLKLVGPFGVVFFSLPVDIFFYKAEFWCVSRRQLVLPLVRLFLTRLQGLQRLLKIILMVFGLGFKWNIRQDFLIFRLGFTHTFVINVPKFLKFKVSKKFTRLVVVGNDYCRLKLFCALLKKLKPVEPYKGKGVRYISEYIKLKVVKKT